MPTRRDYLAMRGALLVVRPAGYPAPAEPADDDLEIFVAITEDGGVTAFNGHVDLGTGLRTALSQIVADELDVALERVTMVLGDTALAPDQGPTVASASIQVTAVPLRHAAAQARRFLLERAAEELGASPAELAVEDGIVRVRDGGNRRIGYGELLKGRTHRLMLSEDVPVKPVQDYRIVGQSVPRADIALKATGGLIFVHDLRLPGMLHGRVVRPPYAGMDSGAFVGNSLLAVDESTIRDIPGVVAVVVIRDFVGVVAEREENAIRAAQALKVTWKPWRGLPDLQRPEQALRANPSTPRQLLDKGDVDAAMAGASKPMPRTYVWPYQLHASIGPSCSVADFRADGLTVWSGTQNPLNLRFDLARLLDLPEPRIEVIRMEAAGCYGRNCADDVGADAALLSRAVGRPVRVQLSREQEHAWEPKGTAQVMDVRGGLNADGGVAAYDFAVRYPSNRAPTLALFLTGTLPPVPEVSDVGDRTAIPPYDYENMRVVVHDMPPIVRAAWMRGVSSLPNSFAHESYIDELATEAGVDPVEYRLRYLRDPRGIDLVKAVAERANWVPRSGRKPVAQGDILRGRGFAYALYVHSAFPGYGAAWSAWVADVEVSRSTGEVSVTKVTVGQDSGLMINPAGVRHQIHGNVIQSTSRALKEQVTFDAGSVTSREWGAYPILTFPELPDIDVLMLPRPDQPPRGVGESASVPSAAAIANAIFDATGVRFREPPFTPDRIKAGLQRQDAGSTKKRRFLGTLAAMFTAAVGIAATALPWRPAIAPAAPPDATLYSAATIARGRMLAAAGDCAVCHTAPGGPENAGGYPVRTPFGIVYGTNITPDPRTGIGAWSYAAFERAMRQGIHRDGRHLYPAFPYTAFTGMDDADLQALYAYLMAQPAVPMQNPRTRLAFPFSLRPLLAAWNTLFLRPGAYRPDASRSTEWNRGAYLVQTVGHCTACHTPRNALGAEKGGSAQLAGGIAEGWQAPPLTAISDAPIPWTEQDFFDFLRTGYSRFHGVAAGPMAPVLRGLTALPDADIRAIAVYLASFNPAASGDAEREALAARLDGQANAGLRPAADAGARIYAGACAVCHEAGGPTLFGVKPSLALNSNLHSDRPDNLIRVILDGIPASAGGHAGAMPGFADSLDDSQLAELLAALRRAFAAGKPPWTDLPAAVARVRDASVADKLRTRQSFSSR